MYLPLPSVLLLPAVVLALPTELHLFKRATNFTLPPLAYALDALQPTISKEIMDLHYNKHHQTYINNLNTAIASLEAAGSDPAKIIGLQAAINFNGGGHINHGLFWENLTPSNSSSSKPSAGGGLTKAVEKKWGSVDKFISEFNTKAGTVQGSGWAWLIKNGDGILEIITKPNQDPVLSPQLPIIGVDRK